MCEKLIEPSKHFVLIVMFEMEFLDLFRLGFW